jgi:hypothetical protein
MKIRAHAPTCAAFLLHFAILMMVLTLLALPAVAQFDTGTIAGSVNDPSGAVVPGATVKVTNTGTSVAKTLKSDQNGNFVVSALPSGTYVVTATSAGFTDAKSKEVVLNVGATVQVKVSLAVAGSDQVVEVTGTATTVDTSSSTAGTTLNAIQVANLPINGRDVNNFLNIAPGSVGSTGFFQGSINGIENIFSGLNITVDGQNATRGDINGFLNTEGQEAARVTRASVDSIQEINFANSGYTAETGHSLGPQMNIVTKQGTNTFHGTAFEFLRNDALDAKDYFNTGKKAPLRMNQFGGNISGPIYRNKLFFFANYEGIRQTITSINALNHTLSAHARQGWVASMQPVLAQLMPLPAGCDTDPAPQSCSVKGFEITGPGGVYQNTNMVYAPVSLPSRLREDTGSVRVDYDFSDNDRLFFRYNISDSLTNYTYGPNLNQVAPQKLRTQLGKIDYTHTFSPTVLNQFSLAVDRFYSDTNSNTGGDPLVTFAGFFADLGSLPGANTFNQVTPFTVMEAFDNVTKVWGKHTLKFGTQIRLNRLNEWLRPQQSYQYFTISDLQTNNPFVLQKIGFPSFIGIRDSNWDFYVQDNWKVTPKLTLNLGVRYDYNTAWREGHDRAQNFDFATQTFTNPSEGIYNAPKGDIAPRIGFAYDPFGTGKTVIRGYGGLFYMPMQMAFGPSTNIPEFSTYAATVFDAFFGGYQITYPSPNPPSPPQNVTIFPRNPKDPYSTNWLFGIQQELAANTVLTMNYTGNKTQHMQAGVSYAAVNLNPSNPFTAARPLPGFASENLECDCLSSNYNALQVQLRHNYHRLNFEANYTWSHEIDDMVNVFSSFSDPFDTSLDRSSGDIDVRHNLTASVVYSWPEMKGSSALVRGVAGGWQTSSILQTRSGLPTNITLISGFFGNPVRPVLVPGQSLTLGSDWPNGGYNPAAFAVPAGYNGNYQDWGSIGRNALRGPEFFQWDFSAMKSFPLSERVQFQFRADLFNILNHPNFANPDGGICVGVTPAGGTTPASCSSGNGAFGVTGQTVGSVSGGAIGNGGARQAQFSLKLIF